jgi:rare lipoprotein A
MRSSARRGALQHVGAVGILAVCLAALTALAGCSSGGTFDSDLGVSSSPRVAGSGDIRKGGGVYKVGRPYRVGGRWYHPHEDPSYDRVGTASWYGTAFHGRRTANGEVYDMYALTAGHPTLPLPSYAYVTNLQNNRTVLVRINDRGPYAKDRLIDLSYQTARTLGFHNHGLARVRVRYAGRAPLNGDDRAERRFLAGLPPAETTRLATASTGTISTGSIGGDNSASAPSWSVQRYRQEARATPPHAPAPSALGAAASSTYLRVGPFASEAEAQRLRFMLAGSDPSAIEPSTEAGGSSFRVRLGPYDDASAAAAMSRIAAAGFEPDASAK